MTNDFDVNSTLKKESVTKKSRNNNDSKKPSRIEYENNQRLLSSLNFHIKIKEICCILPQIGTGN
jgi:hypothetical protein